MKFFFKKNKKNQNLRLRLGSGKLRPFDGRWLSSELRLIFKLSFMLLLVSCSNKSPVYPPSVDPKLGSITKQDFFFYSCIRHYMEINNIKVFDGSIAYAVEYSDIPSRELELIYQSAKGYAATIGEPNYADQEHGLPAVLVVCQKESYKEIN